MLREPDRPLPEGLRQRLRDIPRREVPCRELDRLYRATLSRARAAGGASTARDPAAEKHLWQCPRCRELYTTLASAFAVRRRSLPKRLVGDLRAIARRPRRLVPIWIADARYAAAACYLLAALGLSVAGEASALLRETTAKVSDRAQVWVDESEVRGREAWDATAAKLGRGIDDGWSRAARYGTACEEFFADTFAKIASSTQELIPGRDRPVQGDRDDGSRSDAE